MKTAKVTMIIGIFALIAILMSGIIIYNLILNDDNSNGISIHSTHLPLMDSNRTWELVQVGHISCAFNRNLTIEEKNNFNRRYQSFSELVLDNDSNLTCYTITGTTLKLYQRNSGSQSLIHYDTSIIGSFKDPYFSIINSTSSSHLILNYTDEK